MNPWDIFAAALAAILVLSFFFCTIIVLVATIESWEDWKVEKRERLLKLEHRETEL